MRAKIKFISAERVKALSFGEVKEPSTLNFRTRLPQVGGLFCPKIFGPMKDYKCNCTPPTLKGRQNKGVTCEKCGVTVMAAKERRERAGHIELPVPCIHPLAYLILADILGIPLRDFNQVVDGKLWIGWVPDPDGSIYLKNGIRSSVTVREQRDLEASKRSSMAFYFMAKQIDVEETAKLHTYLALKEDGKYATRLKKTATYLNKVVENGAGLEDLFVISLPVLPAAYRPIIDKGSWIITSTKNDLYARIFWYALRFQRLRDLFPLFDLEIIIQEETTFLQKAVNELFLYGKLDIRGTPLRSLADDIKGKTGLVRGKLLGKRTDFSGRSVISPGPWLKLNEMGLPRKMGINLFKPWIQHWLDLNYGLNVFQTEKMYKEKKKDARIYEGLEEVVKDKLIIMNRAPTLHRIGMLAFKIRLHDGHSCFLHPMVCAPYNADFDGDQMAVHVPICGDAWRELRDLMMPEDNMLSPLDSSPVIGPSHEMIIGTYYMTKMPTVDDTKALPHFNSILRLLDAHERGEITVNQPVVLIEDEGARVTCAGRLMLERLFKIEINEPMTKRALKRLISQAYDTISNQALSIALDKLKDLAYKYVTMKGFSVGMADFHLPSTRQQKMEEAQKFADALKEKCDNGLITEDQRVEGKIRKWMKTIASLQDDFVKEAGDENALVVMLETGARVSMMQVSQLVVAKGVQARSGGTIIEDPIKNCLMTGVDTFDYFMSAYGARKSMADKKTATPKSGYLARRLVNATRDFYISVEDCGNDREGIELPRKIAVGRTTLSGVLVPRNNDDTLTTVRSPIFCTATRGICAVCYGDDATTRKRVVVGEPVGVIAAQSLTEPCTQMTMKTFHTSGAAELKDSPLVIRAAHRGVVTLLNETSPDIICILVDGSKYMVHKELCRVLVKDGQLVKENAPLAVYTSKNLMNQDIGGKLDVLEQYYELTDVKSAEAVVARQEGTVMLLADSDSINIFINGELQGSVSETPVFVHNGERVRLGQFLSFGEANIKDFDNDIKLSGTVFVRRMLELYAEEGVDSKPVHLEMIFRGMSELVEDSREIGKLGLFRYGDLGVRQVFGVSELGRLYPSWLKAIGFGYSKTSLMRAAIHFATTYDLPTERIMMGEYPLFDPVEE